jgi:phosphoglycolate phosphatase
MSAQPPVPAASSRLILWNIDLTLVDVAKVTRPAYAEAFRKVTGRPLVQLPQMAGGTDSEIFFEALAFNPAGPGSPAPPGEELLGPFIRELAAAVHTRQHLLARDGRLLPGARDAVEEVRRLPGVVQSVLTGAIKPVALEKLRAFGLERLFDTDIGGYGSEVYPKGAMLLATRGRAAGKYRADFTENSTVYIADSARDVEAARMGGARSVAVASGRSAARELRDAGAEIVLNDLTDTVAVIRAVNQLTLAGDVA